MDRTGQPRPVTSVIAKRRLRLFGHLARVDPSQDHSRMLRAAIILQRIGDARQVDQGGHGSAQLNLTFSPIILVSAHYG